MSTSRRNKIEEEASVPLKLHIRPATQNLIDRAAKLLRKTRGEFILEASKQRAEEVLLIKLCSQSAPRCMLISWPASTRRRSLTRG